MNHTRKYGDVLLYTNIHDIFEKQRFQEILTMLSLTSLSVQYDMLPSPDSSHFEHGEEFLTMMITPLI